MNNTMYSSSENTAEQINKFFVNKTKEHIENILKTKVEEISHKSTFHINQYFC